MSDATKMLIDCRWLGIGGAGRATELLLRGLSDLKPAGRWLLWGDSRVEHYLWGEAEHCYTRSAPTRMFGQSASLTMPKNDMSIFMHQVRPLMVGLNVTFVHDTIPLRFASNQSRRLVNRAFYRRICATSTLIATVSRVAASAIEDDLGVLRDRIRVVRYPVDSILVEKIRSFKTEVCRESFLLYVGRFAPHKNLKRLLSAFHQTRFAEEGGILLLVGGSDKEVTDLQREVPLMFGSGKVRIIRSCTDDELARLYAECAAVVLASYEEGYGLPVAEAAAAGLPVCASRTGIAPELNDVHLFDPYCDHDIIKAIDTCTRQRVGAAIPQAMVRTEPQFAQEVLMIADDVRSIARSGS